MTVTKMPDLRQRRQARNGRTVLFRCGLLVSGCLTLVLSGALLISGCASKPVSAKAGPDGVQTIKVVVRHGYTPSQIVAKAGQPLKIEFFRDEDANAESCDKELVIPEDNVRIPLPSHESQIVEIKPHQAGEMNFHCGMNMMKGSITFK
jgi:plastocyanin domain-containing protein